MVHGVEVWRRRRLLARLGLRAADAVWAVSRYTAERVVQMQGVRRERVQVLPAALPTELVGRFAPRRPEAISPTPRLLTVTRLDAGERYKGVDACVRAVARLKGRMPSLRYEIVGEGSDSARLRALSVALGLEAQVEFRGHLSDEELAEAYGRAWLFALPSTGEGFGLVVLEAWAAGVPVLVANAGASPELVEDGVTGALVPPGDDEALARRLESLLLGPAVERERLAQAGRARLNGAYLPDSFFARASERLDSLGA
jgi:glycosyltransferase involved in cell wall biosynthesis